MFSYLSTSPLRAGDRRSGPRALCLAQPELLGAHDAWFAAALDTAALGESAAGAGPARTRSRPPRSSFARMAMMASPATFRVPHGGPAGAPEHLLRWLEQRHLRDHGLRGLGFRLDALALEDLAPRVSPDLEIAIEEQRSLLELWACGDRLTHFQRLGLAPTCDQAAIRRAYLAVAQRLHPDRYYGKHIGRFEAVLVELFHRACAAHSHLADPRRCARYVGQLTAAGHAVAEPVPQAAPMPAT
jgi:hypothetical protein